MSTVAPNGFSLTVICVPMLSLDRLLHYYAYDKTSRLLRMKTRRLNRIPFPRTTASALSLVSSYEVAMTLRHLYVLATHRVRPISAFRRRLSARAETATGNAAVCLASVLASDRFVAQCLLEIELLATDLSVCTEHTYARDDVVVFEVWRGTPAYHACIRMYFQAADLAQRQDNWLLVSAPYWTFCALQHVLLHSELLDAHMRGSRSVSIEITNLGGVWLRPSDTVLADAPQLWSPELLDSCYCSFGSALAATKLLLK